jgi:hypothetical protein
MPPPIDPTVVTHGWDTTQIKVVLPTILLTSLVTAVVTEPIKVWIQNLWKRRQIRKHVLGEIAFDFRKVWIISMSVKSGSPESFMRAETERIRFIEYEAAKKEFYLFSRVPDYYLIELFYEALAYTQTECRRYLKEPFELTKGPKTPFGLDASYYYGEMLVNSSLTSRAIAWRHGLGTLIKPKPIRVVIREFFAKLWKRLVASWQAYYAELKECEEKSERPTQRPQ